MIQSEYWLEGAKYGSRSFRILKEYGVVISSNGVMGLVGFFSIKNSGSLFIDIYVLEYINMKEREKS